MNFKPLNPAFSAGIGFLLLLSLGSPAHAQLDQSPIDIRPGNTAFSNLPALNFNYSTGTNLSVINTGSPDPETTIRANVLNGAGSLIFDGDTYNLVQFHFHEPSEHLLNGQEFAMELHLVHQRVSDGQFLVVGRWIEEGSASTLLEPIFSSLPPLSTTPPLAVNNFDLSGLLPSDLSSYQYLGSLTTPPFTGNVQWVVLNETLSLSQDQINAFMALFPSGNVREIQPLDGRTVQTDVIGFAAVPEPNSNLGLLTLGILESTFALKRKSV